MSNGAYAVTISGSAGKAQFGGGASRLRLEAHIARVFRELLSGQQVALPPAQRLIINGMPAAITTARFNTLDVTVAAYQWDAGHVYHFILLTPAGYGASPFLSMLNSLRRITPAEAMAIRPRVIRVVTIARGDTVQSMADRMAYREFKLDRFLALNGIGAGAQLVPGQRVKLVVYGTRDAALRAGRYM
jgi:predicted Zn-dependent protease